MNRNSLNDNGYIILRNKLSEQDINNFLLCIQNDNTVDYKIVKSFIDNPFLSAIHQNIPNFSNPSYVKFRFSNNNNSSDASTFHSDIYNFSNMETLPIYTCLCYFDDSQLQLVPGSHKKSQNNSISVLQSFSNKEIIEMKRGDILVFHANLHHRGINFGSSPNRRLLQVFEVFPDSEIYDKHFNNLVTVITYESFLMKCVNKILYLISKFPYVIDVTNFIHYFLVYYDLQYKIGLMDLDPWSKQGKYISYEPGKRILYEELKNYEDLNINVLCNKKNITTGTSNFYLFIYILYYIISGIIIYVIYYKKFPKIPNLFSPLKNKSKKILKNYRFLQR